MKASTIITAIAAASALLSSPATATQRGLKADNSNKNENAAGKNSDECRELAEWTAGRVVPAVEYFLNDAQEVVTSGNLVLSLFILYLQQYIKELADALGVIDIVGFNPGSALAIASPGDTGTLPLPSGEVLFTLLERELVQLGVSPETARDLVYYLQDLLRGYSSNYTGAPEDKNEFLSLLILLATAVVLTLQSGFATACGGPAPGLGAVRQGDVRNAMASYLLESAATRTLLRNILYFNKPSIISILQGFTGATEISVVGAEAFVDSFFLL